MEIKTIASELKANEEKNIIEGYASIFGNIDSHKDIVLSGSFTKTIQENRNRIKLLWQHDMFEPIGKPLQLVEDSKGLFFEAKVSNTDIGNKAMTLIKDGVLNEMSIGYDTVKSEWDTQRKVRLLKEIKLYEISVITFASNEKALITGAKNIDNILDDVDFFSKSGRTLSNNSMSRIKNAIDALMALLDENEPQEPEETDGCTRKPEKSLKIDFDPDTLQSILATTKKYI